MCQSEVAFVQKSQNGHTPSLGKLSQAMFQKGNSTRNSQWMNEGIKQFADKRKQVAGHHSASNAMFPSQLKENPFYDAFEKDIGILRIFFSEDKILKYVTKNRMSNFDFLSQIGGSLGLAMGISIISIIEIFYWFAFRLFK